MSRQSLCSCSLCCALAGAALHCSCQRVQARRADAGMRMQLPSSLGGHPSSHACLFGGGVVWWGCRRLARAAPAMAVAARQERQRMKERAAVVVQS